MRRLVCGIGLVFLAGCSAMPPGPRVILPNTPAGHACANQCQQIYYACVGSQAGVGKLIIMQHCQDELEQCGLGCPGAVRAKA